MTQPPADRVLRQGDAVGPYRIVSELGVGGMGTVYRAQAPGGEEVALKIVKGEFARDHVFRRRFEREARIAERVTHRHVVAVLDAGEQDGVPYLVQQLVDGGSLADRLEREGRLDPPTAIRVCLQVAGGLDAVHEVGLVHRDVKPANVILDAAGVAYLTDFGLMKDHQASLLTRPGQTLGSLDYIAPEQIRGEPVTSASDVYALGCLMYECLTCAPPFADRQGMRILAAHLHDAPANPCAKQADIPAELGAMVLQALEKDPAARPQSATAYARTLQAAAGLLGAF